MNTPLQERFWSRVEKTASCWNWLGYCDELGYGRIKVHNASCKVHRVAYELLVALIPAGLTIDHKCRNRRCVNPEHLEPVTLRVNILRGDGPTAQNAKKIFCQNGHDLSQAHIETTGSRRCRECRKIYFRSYRRIHQTR